MPTLPKGTLKLRYILDQLNLSTHNELICADFGCNVGGFTSELIKRGYQKVHAIDTGYGALDWKLRNDERVVVRERTNALHLESTEKFDLIVIDMAWTKQEKSIPVALKHLTPKGAIVSLLKPQYEEPSPKYKKAKIFSEEEARQVAYKTFSKTVCPTHKKSLFHSPIQGGEKRKGSFEFWLVIEPKA